MNGRGYEYHRDRAAQLYEDWLSACKKVDAHEQKVIQRHANNVHLAAQQLSGSGTNIDWAYVIAKGDRDSCWNKLVAETGMAQMYAVGGLRR